jgi:hypothetical protein
MTHDILEFNRNSVYVELCGREVMYEVLYDAVVVCVLRDDGDRKQHILFKPPNYY